MNQAQIPIMLLAGRRRAPPPIRPPLSTSKTLVFPFDKEENTFSSEPDLTDFDISFEEINQFIYQIDTEYENHKQSEEKDNSDSICIFFFNIASFYLTSFCLPRFFPNYKSHYSLQKGSVELELTFPLIFTFSLMKVWMWLWPSWKAETYSFDEMRGQCQGIVDEHNMILRSRGLKWNIPLEFPGWIELTKDLEKGSDDLEVVEHHSILQTTENKIIFPAHYFKLHQKPQLKRNYIFSQDLSNMTDDQVFHDEVQDFLSEMNAGYRKALKSFDGQMKEKLIVLPLNILVGFIILVSYLPYSLYEEMGAILWAIFLGFFCIFMLERYGNQVKKEKTQVWTECQKIVEKYNETFLYRGLRWHLPEKFPLWIELCKEDMLAENVQYDIEAQNFNYERDYHKKNQRELYAQLL